MQRICYPIVFLVCWVGKRYDPSHRTLPCDLMGATLLLSILPASTIAKGRIILCSMPLLPSSQKRRKNFMARVGCMLICSLSSSYTKLITLTGILIFHRIADCRMRGTPLKNLSMFQELCGTDALGNVILTTTMWDEIPEEVGLRREKQLQAEFWQPMMVHGCRTARFTFTRKSAWDIIDMFDVRSNFKLRWSRKEKNSLKRRHTVSFSSGGRSSLSNAGRYFPNERHAQTAMILGEL
jgi:hypothetical protein